MQVILLIIAVSVDVFVACVACGSEQIKIGSAAALCISTVCSGILGISLYAGMALQGVLLKKYALYLSFFGLLAVGIFKLTEYAIRKYIERHKFLCKKVKISFSQLSFILSIYNNPVMADRDHSERTPAHEASTAAASLKRLSGVEAKTIGSVVADGLMVLTKGAGRIERSLAKRSF